MKKLERITEVLLWLLAISVIAVLSYNLDRVASERDQLQEQLQKANQQTDEAIAAANVYRARSLVGLKLLSEAYDLMEECKVKIKPGPGGTRVAPAPSPVWQGPQ